MKQRLAVIGILIFASTVNAQISPQFFAMHAYSQWNWPTKEGVQLASWRTEPISSLQWAGVNTSSGVYNWSALDSWIATAQQSGVSVLYTVWVTPSWASSCPKCLCFDNRVYNGGCYPPNDVNADGSGTDQNLKNFITAMMKHLGPGKINYIEVWNEPNILAEWAGTVQQLARMAMDIRTIAKSYDPNVMITSPAETGDGNITQGGVDMKWLTSYLAAGGGAYADVIALHGYVGRPEDIITRINNTTGAMAQYGQSGKPIYVTEGSWALKINLPARQQPGFSFRHYLSMLSTPAQRFYLMAFDNPQLGNLFSDPNNAFNPPGVAYQLFYNWLVGATMTQPCKAQSNNSSVWSCTFTRSGGYQAEAIWSTSLPWGQKTTVTVPSQYTQYRDLYNNLYQIKSNQVPIGYDPIWLEN